MPAISSHVTDQRPAMGPGSFCQGKRSSAPRAVATRAVARKSSDAPNIRLEIGMNHLGCCNSCPQRKPQGASLNERARGRHKNLEENAGLVGCDRYPETARGGRTHTHEVERRDQQRALAMGVDP